MVNLNIIKYRKFWLIFSAFSAALALVALMVWGLNLGLDFTGGNLMEIKFKGLSPSVVQVEEKLSDLNLNSLGIQPTADNSIILRFKDDSTGVRQTIIERLSVLSEELNNDPQVEELRFDSVGPSVGQELKSKAFNALALAVVLVILYITIVFRKVSRPVASWKYGLSTVIASIHNILIVLGVFSILGHFFKTEINATFIAAILTVLGHSVNDIIITFDRIRENLPTSTDNFKNTVNHSINQTLVRNINTSASILLTLIAIIIFGGDSIREFVLALAIGIFVGTYSSIFIASPLLTLFDRRIR